MLKKNLLILSIYILCILSLLNFVEGQTTLYINGSSNVVDTYNDGSQTSHVSENKIYALSGTYRIFIRFVISSIPSGKQISSVFLNLSSYNGGNGAGPINVYNFSSAAESWTDYTNNAPARGTLIGTNSSACLDATGSPCQANVTSYFTDKYGEGNSSMSLWIECPTTGVGCGGADADFYATDSGSSAFMPLLTVIYFDSIPPTTSFVSINITNSSASTAENINSSFLVLDSDNDSMNATAYFIINDVINLTLQLPNNYANGTNVSVIFNSTNITQGNVVKIAFNVSDGTSDSNHVNSTAITIIDGIVPTVNIDYIRISGTDYTNGSNLSRPDAAQFSGTLFYNVSDAGLVSNCSLYTLGALETVNTTTQIQNTNIGFLKTDFTASNSSYTFITSCRDNSNNQGNSSTFTLLLSILASGSTTGGGGGGSALTLFNLGAICTKDGDCKSNVCDLNSTVGPAVCNSLQGLCGNGFCDRRFNESTICPKDCTGFAVISQGLNIKDTSLVTIILPLLIIGAFVLVTLPKNKKIGDLINFGGKRG